jgi:hypothetical protein
MLHETGREVKNYGHTVYRALGSHHRLGKKARARFWNPTARCLTCGSNGACFTTILGEIASDRSKTPKVRGRL